MLNNFKIQKVEVNGNGYSPKIGTKVYEEYDNFILLNPDRTLDTKYSAELLWKRYNNIINKPGDYYAIPTSNTITYHFFDNFYKTERELWKDVKIQEFIYKNRKKYIGKTQENITNEELLRGFKISGIHFGYSHFSPFWFKAFIEEFNIHSVIDPTGGWGQRMLGSHDLDLYVYNDAWDETAQHAKEQKEFFGLKNVVIHNENSAEFSTKYDVDAVFTCPPYISNKEIYSPLNIFKDNLHYSQWWKNTLMHILTPSIKYIAYVTDASSSETLKIITESMGFKLVKIQPIGKGVKNHFSKNKKEKEQMYIFQK